MSVPATLRVEPVCYELVTLLRRELQRGSSLGLQ